MTVSSLGAPGSGLIKCVWFDKNHKRQSNGFRPATLVKIDPETSDSGTPDPHP